MTSTIHAGNFNSVALLQQLGGKSLPPIRPCLFFFKRINIYSIQLGKDGRGGNKKFNLMP
jgi:hypothetical protein